MKKILLFQPYLTPYRIGLFNAIQAKQGVDLTVLYFSRPEQRRKWNLNRNLNFKEIQLHSLVFSKNYETNKVYTNIFHLLWVLLTLRPDIVICCSNREGRIAARMKRFLKNCLIFWTEEHHQTKVNNPEVKKCLRQYFESVDLFIVPGKRSAEFVKNSYSAGNDRIIYAPNTVDEGIYNATSKEVSEKFADPVLRFLFCGNLTQAKGFDLLLESVHMLNRQKQVRPFHFHILGDGPIKEEPLEHVTYHGYCDSIQCASIMAKTHIFVLPSLRDCNPLTVLETARTGHVLLLSDAVGNYPEYMPICGSVFACGNLNALYEALTHVLKIPSIELMEIAQQSRLLGETFTHQRSADAFVRAVKHCGY